MTETIRLGGPKLDPRRTVTGMIALSLAFAFLVLALSGCAIFDQKATASDKYADAERAFQIALDTTKAAVVSKKITDVESLTLIKAALIEANAMLIDMRQNLARGDTPNADYFLARVEAALVAWQNAYNKGLTSGPRNH